VSTQPISVAVIGAGMAGRAHAAGYRNVNAEMFTYQARAFLDQVAGAPDPLPACASFSEGPDPCG
jgi:predicted dehydrogenase